MKEAIIYLIAAVAGLTVMGFSVHMLVGGLISASTEYGLILAVCLAGALILIWMAKDVMRRRQSR